MTFIENIKIVTKIIADAERRRNTDILDECLLRLDIIKQHNFHLNIRKNILKIGNEVIFLYRYDGEDIPIMKFSVKDDVHI